MLRSTGSWSKRESIAIMVSLLVLYVIDQVCWKERPCSLHRGLAEVDVCDGPDGVYQLALKFSPMKPGGTGYRVLFIKRTF